MGKKEEGRIKEKSNKKLSRLMQELLTFPS